MVLKEVMIMMLFFFEFYLNLGYHVKFKPKTVKQAHAKAMKCGFGCNFCIGIAISSIHCKLGNLLLADSTLNLTSHRGEISTKVSLNGYLRGHIIRSYP
ncbi:hypothetical protein AMTRI_Chr02g215590 [Amborella trichopoda]